MKTTIDDVESRTSVRTHKERKKREKKRTRANERNWFEIFEILKQIERFSVSADPTENENRRMTETDKKKHKKT